MRLVILFLTLTSNIVAEEIIGFPKIVDGDTVHINKYKITLEGIDAPEIRQKCKKEKLKISSIIGFTFYKDYNCGEVSREKLKKKVDRLIKIGVLKKINISQWAAPTFIIPKINGTVRFISYFRELTLTI